MTGVDGYLLDTCIISYWYDERRKQHPHVVARIETLPDETPLRISSITLGEVEYGHRAESPTMDTPVQVVYREFIANRLPNALNISRGTAFYYGRIRARLFEKFIGKRKRKHLRPEQATDPVTGKELGIDENDLWIAAQAAERNLVLVTSDAMHHIRAIVGDLLRIENWAIP